MGGDARGPDAAETILMEQPGSGEFRRPSSARAGAAVTPRTRASILLVGLLSAVLFAALSVSVEEGSSFTMDRVVGGVVTRRHTPGLDKTARALSLLGSAAGVGAAVVLMSLRLWRVDRRTAIYLAAYTAGTPLFIEAAKLLVHRDRPNGAPLGFPSGHALAALAVFGLLVTVLLPEVRPRFRRLLVAATTALVLGVGFSRIYLGVHWTTDVLGGYLGGLTYLMAGAAILHTGSGRKLLRSEPAGPPPAPDRSGLRVTIFSCTYGGGHHRVAEVLAQELRRLPGCDVTVYDYIETFLGHLYNVVSTFFYVGTVRWVPWIWRWFYRTTSDIAYDSFTQRFINGLGKGRLARFLTTRRPDLVVCTYCVPAGAISELKQAGTTQVPCVTVVTDHAVHSQWIHPYVDLFLVSSEHVRDGLVARGIPAERVLASGIPIDPRFAVAVDRRDLRRARGLDPDRPVILAMVGAANLVRGPLDLYRTLTDLPRSVQILFVCGRDERLRRAIEALTPAARNPVHVFGYVRDVYELMAISDLMVSKAGGVTTSEALAAGLPMIAVSPVPGQEEENLSYLTDLGAVVGVATPAELRRVALDLLDHPDRLEQMREAARRVKRPDAAARAADAILALTPAGRTLASGRR